MAIKRGIYPSFRSEARKTTPPRDLRDEDGWYRYACVRCGAALWYRKRQRHPACVWPCPGKEHGNAPG
jgi:hypothetical protein